MSSGKYLATMAIISMAVGGEAALADSAPITGSGEAELTVEDILTPETSESHDIDGFGSDLFSLSGIDGSAAQLAYDFSHSGNQVELDVSSWLNTGPSLGTGIANLSFDLFTARPVLFDLSIEPGQGSWRLPSGFRLSFADVVAESFMDISAPGGIGGNIGVDGVFSATGQLGAGAHHLSLEAIEASFRNTALFGGAHTTLTLRAPVQIGPPRGDLVVVPRPTSAPLPTATMLGGLVLGALGAVGGLRRPQR